MTKRRVVVTGLGLISPVGNQVDTAWGNIIAGRSGIAPITRFDATAFSSRIAGEVRDFDVTRYIPAKDARRMADFIHYGMAAGIDAIQDAGLSDNEADNERIGVAISSGIGGLPLIEDTTVEYVAQGGPRKISPFFVPGSIINMISGNLSIMYGYQGPNIALVSACTTGTHSIGDASRIIEYGDADVMIAGGSEATVSPLGVGGFCAAKALSTRNDDPEGASRPWDQERDGFVLSEGAGAMVLEAYEHAKARGARIYAEVAGYGMSGDAFHMTAPNVSGPTRCMQAALKNGGVNPDEVHYLNAHGTSTPLGDKNETDAIKATFGGHARSLAISSTKSMTGHLLGGAGGLESVLSVLSIYHQIAPPTINLHNQDPECDLDYCANEAREMTIAYVLKNNFGFGGTNGSLLFKQLR